MRKNVAVKLMTRNRQADTGCTGQKPWQPAQKLSAAPGPARRRRIFEL
jgi:hypothetical protein